MFSLSGMQPLFPSLLPRQVDPLWHEVDVAKDEDAELAKLEKDHETWMKSFTSKRSQGQPPIGTQSQEALDEEEMEEEEDDDDDHDNEEDSDSRVDEDDVEMDMNFGAGQESPVNVLPSS